MSEINKYPLEIGRIVHKVGTSEVYTRARSEAETLDLDERDRRRRAILLAATALKGEQGSGYLSAEGHAMNLTAHLTSFSESIRELRTLEESGARRKEKLPALYKVAEFNHAVKDMIDSNPSLTFSEVSKFILSMNQTINGRVSGGPRFEHEVTQRLVGMSHEIAVEQMLGYMPGVDYQEATVDDDVNGIDLFVSIDGSPMTPIDIKASSSTAQIKKRQAIENGYSASNIVWSHVDNKEFNGTFRIPNDLAEARSADLYNDLRRAVRAQHAPVTQLVQARA